MVDNLLLLLHKHRHVCLSMRKFHLGLNLTEEKQKSREDPISSPENH